VRSSPVTAALRARHERRVSRSAGNVEHPLAGADAPTPHDMVSDRLDALGDLLVVSGCPGDSMLLLQLSEIRHSAAPFVWICDSIDTPTCWRSAAGGAAARLL